MARAMAVAGVYARPGFLLRPAHRIAVGVFVEACALHKLTTPRRSSLS